MQKLYVLSFLLLALIGCGVKGDPLPPLPDETPSVEDQKKTEEAKKNPAQSGT